MLKKAAHPKKNNNLKSNTSVLSLVVSVILAVSAVSAFRFIMRRDLMDINVLSLSLLKSIAAVIAAALLPAFVALFVLLLIHKWIEKSRNRIINAVFLFLVGIFIFFWGLASSRPSHYNMAGIIQGILGLMVFYAIYVTFKKHIQNKVNINLQRVCVVLILVVWAGFLAYTKLKDRDYLWSPFQVPSSKDSQKLPNFVVLGIDGTDWTITNTFIEAGYLPAVQSLVDKGSWAPLHTIKPTSSPYIWNTIYTGFMPDIHQLRPSVMVLPFNTIYKRNHSLLPDFIQMAVPLLFPSNQDITHYPLAFWDILQRKGYTTAVIGNWENQPLSTRGAVNLPDVVYPSFEVGVLDLNNFARDKNLVKYAQSINIPPDRIPLEEWRFFTSSGKLPKGLFQPISESEASPELLRLARFRQMYATDRFRFLLTERVLQSIDQPYCLFLYTHGIDLITHCYLHLYEHQEVSEEEPYFQHIIRKYYTKTDQWIGQLLSILPANTVIIVLSDHGFDSGFYQKHPYKTGFHYYAPNGIFIAAGPNISHRKLESVHVLDVAPSILSLAGVPVLANMQGASFLTEEGTYNVQIMDWWTMKKKLLTFGDSKLLDKETEKKLKSLGYIK